jgi:hypothetical protein
MLLLRCEGMLRVFIGKNLDDWSIGGLKHQKMPILSLFWQKPSILLSDEY